MTEAVSIPLDAVSPSVAAVLARQGMPPGATVRDKVAALAERSLGILAAEAQPRCVLSRISLDEFGQVFRGEGRNDDAAPLQAIYPRAHRLAVFALTLGQPLSETIEDAFRRNEFALGAMLDSVASLAVENAVGLLERRSEEVRDRNDAGGGVTLSYSPGYCGWHLTAQKALFRHLNPQQIGITLNDSCLMTPMKSATGVLVHGARDIHDFDIGFSFCRACKGHSCLERRAGLAAAGHTTQ